MLASRASSTEIERVQSAIVASIELLSIEAIAVVLLTPVRFGQLVMRLGPVLLRLRRLVIACETALTGYSSTETSLLANLSDFRTAVPALANRLVTLATNPTVAWAKPSGVAFVAPAPSGLAQISARLRLLSNSGRPLVRIEQYQAGEHRKFIVYVPGTQNLSLSASSNPFDMRSNLQLMVGGRSNAARATELAIGRAGVGPNDQVMLVGHSQGGLIALDLAKRSIAGQVGFRVEQVITFGTPAGSNNPDSLPNVLSIENRADLVPKLEFRENPNEQNWLTWEGNVETDLVSAHRMESYEQIVAKLGDSSENRRQIEAIERFATSAAKVSYFELGQR
jgi:hypothetical protein